jgi:hypothetical protein
MTSPTATPFSSNRRRELDWLMSGEHLVADFPRDPLDVPLEDAELLHEVHLLAELIVAAGERERRLAETEVDRLLGL